MKDEKFKISLESGRTGLIYKENGKTLFIDSEMLAEPSSIAIHKTTELFWNPPHEYEVITANERDRIFKNVVNYFIENGWHVDEVKVSKSPSEQNKVIHDVLESYRKKGWNIAKVKISPSSDSNYHRLSGPNVRP